ncbi:MAG: DUF349 domain-containing protein [Gammaproteobacteria bacterium]|nr:DUF349 domain-containing protein [Gammaproteobacteria bacterium]
MRVKNILKSDPRKIKDPDERLLHVQQLDESDSEVQEQILSLVDNDDQPSIRLLAIGKLTSIEALWQRYSAFSVNDIEAETMHKRLAELLADSTVTEAALSPVTKATHPGAQLLLANNCALASVRVQALQQIQSEDALAEVVSRSRYHETRLQAATQLTDLSLVRRALDASRDKDKVVSKHLQQLLDAESAKQAKQRAQEEAVRESVKMAEKLSSSVWSPQTAARFTTLQARWNELDKSYTKSQQELMEVQFAKIQQMLDEHVTVEQVESPTEDELLPTTDEQPVPSNSNSPSATEESASVATVSPPLDAVTSVSDNPEIAKMQEKLVNVALADLPRWLSDHAKDVHPDTQNLLAHCQAVAVLLDPPFEVVKARVGAVQERQKRIDVLLATETILPGLHVNHFQYVVDLHAHRRALDERLVKAKQESADRVKATHRQFAALGGAIKDGKWGPANSMFKRLQKKVASMEAQERVSLNDKLSRAEKQLDDMADWQDFAARPKLEALCVEMEALPAQALKPQVLAKTIKSLQSNWKGLGVSRASNELWSRFKEAGDAAYEPCKVYFEELNAQREAKLAAKAALCEQLESEFAEVDWASIDWKKLQKTLNQAKRTWRDNRISNRKPDKALEDRFTKILSPLDDKLKEQYDANALLKTDLIEKATQLASGEINQHVINQTKSLQSAWKQIGVMRRKEDQELWEQFNTQCRNIFKSKHEQDREGYKASMGHVFRARDIIKELKSLAKTQAPDDSAVQALVAEFQGLAEFPERDKRGLIKDFRSSVDACSRVQEGQRKKRFKSEKNEQLRLVGLCEQLEKLAELHSDSADTQVDDVKSAWEASDVAVSRDFAKRVEARRDQALAHIAAGTQYDYEANEKLRRDLLIQMEVAAGIDTPAEDKARRMEFQLKHLQEGMTAQADKGEQLKTLELEWFGAGPVLEARREKLNARFKKAVSR